MDRGGEEEGVGGSREQDEEEEGKGENATFRSPCVSVGWRARALSDW